MRLNQVTVAVTDLSRAVGYYRRLGLRQIVAAESYARFA
jgi:catechol 2,3-dioxygenase-like lactoylglutathione lyase family enzyme